MHEINWSVVSQEKSQKLLPRDVTFLRLKCTKFDFSAGAPPQAPLGELTALPQTCILGPTSKGVEERGEGERREGRGREGKEGRGGEGRERYPPHYLM